MADDDLRPGLGASELRGIALLLGVVAALAFAPVLVTALSGPPSAAWTLVLSVVTLLVALCSAVCAVAAGQKASEARLRAELQYLVQRRATRS